MSAEQPGGTTHLVDYHGEFKKGLLLFREIEKTLDLKRRAASTPELEAEEARQAVATFYRTWGASALATGDYTTASEKIDLAIAYSSASECSVNCSDEIEEYLQSLGLLANLQSSQGKHAEAAETRRKIAEKYREANTSSSQSNELMHQGFMQALIEEGWARLDIGDFSGANKLISEAQESAKHGAPPRLIDEINAIKAALDYRVGNEIASPRKTGSKLDQSAYSFAQGDKASALRETLNKQPFAGHARLILVDETLANRVLS